MLIDSHCHLEFDDFKDDFDLVLQRASSSGIEKMLTIGTKLSTLHKAIKIAGNHNNVFASVGVHPSHVHEEGIVTSDKLIALCQHPKIIGIGETGLDYHYMRSSKEDQIKSFIEHIKAAQETGLPIIVHTRDADEDTVAIIKEQSDIKKFKFLIHCFTSSEWLATECLKIGGYISTSGIITFKNATDIQNTIKKVDINKLLIETDSPYLAPVPHRGKRNEPAFVKHIAEFVAELKGLSYDEVASNTTKNFYTLFDKAGA